MSMNKHNELAIINGVEFGMRDAPWPCLSFNVTTLDFGALQILHYEQAIELIKKHHIKNIEDLEGAPCIVEIDEMKCVFKDLKK